MDPSPWNAGRAVTQERPFGSQNGYGMAALGTLALALGVLVLAQAVARSRSAAAAPEAAVRRRTVGRIRRSFELVMVPSAGRRR